MRFFTRELYLRFNSPDDANADRADAEWEEAVSAYHTHLSRFSETMNDRVRKFAEELCLHDTELLALQEDVVTSPTLPPDADAGRDHLAPGHRKDLQPVLFIVGGAHPVNGSGSVALLTASSPLALR